MNPLFLAALSAALGAAPAPAQGIAVNTLPMGRCVGNAAPEVAPTGGKPYDLASDPGASQVLPYWKLIGYKADASGHLIGPDGQTAGSALMAWMNEPEDFSHVRVPESDWMGLLMAGFRLDEQACTLKGPQGTLSRFSFQIEREFYRRANEKGALEHLQAGLADLDPKAPIPSSVIDGAKALAQAGVHLPPNVAKLLADPSAHVGALAASVDAAYADSTHFFDGERKWGDLAKGALPPVLGVTAKRPTPVVMEPEEQRLGRIFATDLEKKFSLTPEGRELLDHFRGKDGKVNFPPILFLKENQRSDDRSMPGATFDFVNGAMVLNHWQAMYIVLASLPPAERERRASELTDPKNLRHYLEAHPEAREALVDEFDSGFYHEFIHAWQSQRSSYDIEMVRGNAPANNPLVKEYEAYREQCRYEFSLAFRNPSVIEKRSYLIGYCLPMLKDYDKFRDGISRMYLSTFAGTSELSDIVKIQRQRESMAQRLMGDGLYQKALQTFKLAGMFHGDEALRDLQLDSAQREQKFIRERLPPLRERALQELPSAYCELGRPDLALLILNSLPSEQHGLAHARRVWADESEFPLLHPYPQFTLPGRIAVLQALSEYYAARKESSPKPVADAYWRDVRAYVKSLFDQGQAAKDPKIRADLLKAAAAWSAALPKDDPLRKRLSPSGTSR